MIATYAPEDDQPGLSDEEITMPMTTCGQCGAPAFISDQEQEAGSEVYCSEACANGKPDDQFEPPVETTDE